MGIVSKMKRRVSEFTGSIRRNKLGLGIFNGGEAWYLRNGLGFFLKDKFLPNKLISNYNEIFRQNAWLIHANAKKALASRSTDDFPFVDFERIDHRREWNLWRETVNLLDYFPNLKYSDSKLPTTCNPDGTIKLMSSSKKKGRFAGLARSNSIWLDAVEAPKRLYRYRLRIQNCIDWTYKQDYVPIMMTLTIYHQWHDLRNLLEILTKAWNEFTANDKKRRGIWNDIVKGWIRRLEITINDGTEEVTSNKGWHPHFHTILLIPKHRLQELSDAEQEWRDAWVKAVCKYFEKVEGEVIGEGYVNALRRHGLLFSRDRKGNLRPVKDSKYMAKIMGYDNAAVFGGDTELTTNTLKDSKTPFDLLLFPELSANNIDLFCEYALATKGVQAFRFSKDLEKKVNEYYAAHPKQSAMSPCPTETVVAAISHEAYQIVYQNFKVEELKAKISEGYDAVCNWFKQTFTELGCPELCEIPLAMPFKPPD